MAGERDGAEGQAGPPRLRWLLGLKCIDVKAESEAQQERGEGVRGAPGPELGPCRGEATEKGHLSCRRQRETGGRLVALPGPGERARARGIFPPCRDSPTQAVPSSLGSKPRPQRRLLRHRYPL